MEGIDLGRIGLVRGMEMGEMVAAGEKSIDKKV